MLYLPFDKFSQEYAFSIPNHQGDIYIFFQNGDLNCEVEFSFDGDVVKSRIENGGLTIRCGSRWRPCLKLKFLSKGKFDIWRIGVKASVERKNSLREALTNLLIKLGSVNYLVNLLKQ